MMKTAFMFFGRVSADNLAPSLSGSINLRRSIMGVRRTFIYWPRRGRTHPMPEFAELMEMVVGFVPAPTVTFKQKTILHLMLSLTTTHKRYKARDTHTHCILS